MTSSDGLLEPLVFALTGRVRLRCAAENAAPWLAGLHVFWRPAPTDHARFDRPFSLGRVDAQGYLAPVGSEESPLAALLMAGMKYELYFVHHPDPAFAAKFARRPGFRASAAALRSAFGPPTVLVPRFESTAARDASAQELVLRVPENPCHFHPQDTTEWVRTTSARARRPTRQAG